MDEFYDEKVIIILAYNPERLETRHEKLAKSWSFIRVRCLEKMGEGKPIIGRMYKFVK